MSRSPGADPPHGPTSGSPAADRPPGPPGSEIAGVRLRLLLSVLALVAGIAGVVITVALLRSVLG
jgi:hypothetical protein